jgi:ABC-type transporter Mla maintaining outer membrane lipid asymmetry ATPase subunit MlaF
MKKRVGSRGRWRSIPNLFSDEPTSGLDPIMTASWIG